MDLQLPELSKTRLHRPHPPSAETGLALSRVRIARRLLKGAVAGPGVVSKSMAQVAKIRDACGRMWSIASGLGKRNRRYGAITAIGLLPPARSVQSPGT